MKPPPLLIGAGLLFWGWQTGHLFAGELMAVVLEAPHLVKARWEIAAPEFNRIWFFSSLLLFTAMLYAFSDNQGPAGFGEFFARPSFFTTRAAGNAASKTAAAVLSWLPMIFFLFVATQAYSALEAIPADTIALILGLRWKRAAKSAPAAPPARGVNVSYLYFALCLYAASVHSGEDSTFYWGLCLLVVWALWPQRSPRYGLTAWIAALALAVGLGFVSYRSLGRFQNYLSNLNPTWFSNFGHHRADPAHTRTQLGQIGRLKLSGKIVIRLEPKEGTAPGLLREASYRNYKEPFWHSEIMPRDFQDVLETNRTTYLLLHDKTNSAAATISCYLPGGNALLPLPAGSGRLENLFAISLKRNALGAVLDQGPAFVAFDAFYGPGPTIDSAPSTNEDLAVPPSETPALDQVISDLRLSSQTKDQAVRTLKNFFLNNFTYSTWLESSAPADTNETALTRFLLHTRSGHCEYFATAATLLLRQAGIPARYAIGYAVHEASGRKFVVRERDGHAWCLVWDKAAGLWQDFDPTPPSWVEVEGQRASAFQFLSDGWSWLSFQFSRLRWGQTHLRQYILWALIPLLALLLYQIVFRTRRQRHRPKAVLAASRIIWPGLDSEFYELERTLAARGIARQPSEPLSQWLCRAGSTPAPAGLTSPSLQELLLLHYRYRFDPRGLNALEREELRHETRLCLDRLRRAGND